MPYYKLKLKACLLFLSTPLLGWAQDNKDLAADSLMKAQDMEEFVVSATRTEKNINDVPMPVMVIKDKDIDRMGALRLNEILAEQTGIQVIQDHGAGVQIQGLSTDYILILVDGEPIVGRTNGNLDLRRIVVGSIERIEVVKGPSSSLFGSEAMGGVINIITKKGKSDLSGSLRARYRRYNTLDVSAEAGQQHDKLGWYLFANRMSSDGYFTKGAEKSITKTIPPFVGHTVNGRISYRFNDNLELVMNARFYNEDQKNSKIISVSNDDRIINERTNRKDFSLTPTLFWHIAPGKKLQVKNHITSFQTRTIYNFDDDNSVYDDSYFKQFFNRSEVQYDHQFSVRHIFTAGAGNIIEGVNATRFDDKNRFNQLYVFAQHQWQPIESVNIVGGFRYDKHNHYADRFSPKLAAGWHINKVFSIQASLASGYKAPTFEQLLLNFTNPTVGYTVLGTNVAQEQISRLQAEGQIDRILIDPSNIGAIKAETSMAYNAGFKINLNDEFLFQTNFFRNNISDMIDFNTIAIKTNQGAIYSYFNRNKVFTTGVEVNTLWKLPYGFDLSAGYQYLDAKDAEVWNKVRNGQVYYRDENNLDKKVSPSDYGGLYNRSRHTGNIKLNYTNKTYDFDISLRGIFRSRFGSGLDINGNGILDDSREYVKGYDLWNISARKFTRHFTFEAGLFNIFSVHTPYDPSTPPLNWYMGVSYQFQKKTIH